MSDKQYQVNLPQTPFQMKANLPSQEPKWLQIWEDIKLYKKLREKGNSRKRFILHDGPPYANGNLHIGHALNKTLKDLVVRTKQMQGFDAPYVPGWDCHGLPIEWKIEEEYRAKKLNKDDVPVLQFRDECRKYAAKWVKIQSDEFKRLGIMGDFENPYKTDDFKAESIIVDEIGKLLIDGSLYRGLRPVMWSPIEKTALAEAEVEYQDVKSDIAYVNFKIIEAPNKNWVGSYITIWTTTPWTIPANLAMAYGEKIVYSLYEIEEVKEGSLAEVGVKIVIADELSEKVFDSVGILKAKKIESQTGLSGFKAYHPLHGMGYEHEVPLLMGDFVTTEAGTGIVHTAPDHGEEDFQLCKKHGISPKGFVLEDGTYAKNVPLFAGLHVYKANVNVLQALENAKMLLGKGSLVHSYPHSWRSKKPLIYRTTPQWFVSMDKLNLRQKALAEIDKVNFFPQIGKNRLRVMVETRPDWCLSRQRVWGVPLPIFVHKETGEPLRDKEVVENIKRAFLEQGADCWFKDNVNDLLPSKYNKNDYVAIKDVVDVWFDSGCTHVFVLENREELSWPADFYLEGSDQHRGWFQSSLLESVATRGKAPYKNIVTHGMVLDGKGQKMSKSLGNVIMPEEIIKEFGVDILRLWVVGSNYYEDLRISKDIMKQHAEIYRKVRNTLRFLLGNIKSEVKTEPKLDSLDKYVLFKLNNLHTEVMKAVEEINFHKMFKEIYSFCDDTLSAFYFDVRKDVLYCDSENSDRFIATQYVLNNVFECLVRYLAPIIPFTAEEAYTTKHGDSVSVHTQDFIAPPSVNFDNNTGEVWAKILEVRAESMAKLEKMRANKEIGASLEAKLEISAPKDVISLLQSVDFADICIVSKVEFKEGVDLVVSTNKANGHKCPRCWKFEESNNTDNLCNRCNSVVG